MLRTPKFGSPIFYDAWASALSGKRLVSTDNYLFMAKGVN